MQELNTQKWRIDLAYDGRLFSGFQSQPHRNTIQDLLENALRTATRESVRIIGGSRTDAGVSAENQVCAFQTSIGIEPNKLIRSLNALLPDTIKVTSLQHENVEFHPIIDSTGKIYRYRIWRGFCLDPFVLPYVWQVNSELDSSVLNGALQDFVGTHNFEAFSNSGSEVKSFIRKIFEIKVTETGPLLEIWVHGEGFLKQMVRNMVGTAVDISLGKIGFSVKDLIYKKDRKAAGQTAPGYPLCLVKSNFADDDQGIASQIKFASAGLSMQFRV